MSAEYAPDDMLPLSGIQHFVFCRRQWGLMQIERQWQDNVLTVEGTQLHERADDPFLTEKRKGVIVARAVPVSSPTLGLAGICDVVEFTSATDGVRLPRRAGHYTVAPVEYKRGKPKEDGCDEAQLCAQAICLEEMLMTSIPTAFLFYGQTRRRVPVTLTESLRETVRKAAAEMHVLFERGHTPKVKPFKGCRSCSLLDLCVPTAQGKVQSVTDYIRTQVEVAGE